MVVVVVDVEAKGALPGLLVNMYRLGYLVWSLGRY